MAKYEYAIEIRNGSSGQDRANLTLTEDGFVAVLADGAGGIGGGAEAANFLCERVRELATTSKKTWDSVLSEVDNELFQSTLGGMSTGVIVEVSHGYLVGASVGDSGALLLKEDGFNELTAKQSCKPLLGSGSARPVAFGPLPFAGRLLMASDGLLKYMPIYDLVQIARGANLSLTASALAEAVRLPSGAFHDDVAVLVSEASD